MSRDQPIRWRLKPIDSSSLLRAMSHRNFRLFLLGQSISLIGTWMQQVAVGWLMYRLTSSPWYLGFYSFASQIPSLFLSPFAGVAADRWNRHRTIVITQMFAMLQAVLLLLVVQFGGEIVWPLMLLGFTLGLINAFDMPVRQSFLVDMVPNREHLGNAIALNSSVVNAARLIGPSLAGLVIAAWGEKICFLLNALSYVAVLIALALMRDLPVRQQEIHGNILDHLKQGVVYAFGFIPLRVLLLMLALVSVLSTSLSVLMPVFARDIYHGTASTQGLLMGAMGIGSLLAAIYLASRKTVLGLGRVLVGAALVFGTSEIAFSYTDNLYLSLPLLVVIGCCMILYMATSNTLIQTIVEEDKRGRVMSLYSIAFLGVSPLGALISGFLAQRIGAQATVRCAGVICIAIGLCLSYLLPQLRKLIRPIYQQIGILPMALPDPEPNVVVKT